MNFEPRERERRIRALKRQWFWRDVGYAIRLLPVLILGGLISIAILSFLL